MTCARRKNGDDRLGRCSRPVCARRIRSEPADRFLSGRKTAANRRIRTKKFRKLRRQVAQRVFRRIVAARSSQEMTQAGGIRCAASPRRLAGASINPHSMHTASVRSLSSALLRVGASLSQAFANTFPFADVALIWRGCPSNNDEVVGGRGFRVVA